VGVPVCWGEKEIERGGVAVEMMAHRNAAIRAFYGEIEVKISAADYFSSFNLRISIFFYTEKKK
jgi:hypothetical protein